MVRLSKALLIVVLFSITLTYAQKIEKNGGFARVISLGNNPFIHDPEFIKINPAYAGVYTDLIWGDIGGSYPGPGYTSDGQFLGVNFALDEQFTLGVLLTRDDAYSFNTISTIDPYFIRKSSTSSFLKMNNNLELFSSYRTKNAIFGLGVAYASAGDKFTPPLGTGTEATSKQIGINVGCLLDLTSNISIDAAISFLAPTYKYESASTTKEISQTVVSADVRSFIQLSGKLTLVPRAYFVSTSGTATLGSIESDLDANTVLGAGFGINYRVGDFLLAGGPGFEYNNHMIPSIAGLSPEMNNTIVSFPVWNIGAEWNALSWLIARIGFTGGNSSRTYDNAVGVNAVEEYNSTQYDPYGFHFGIGLKFGNFELDATINDNVLRDGFGNFNRSNPTFSYLSMSYAF